MRVGEPTTWSILIGIWLAGGVELVYGHSTIRALVKSYSLIELTKIENFFQCTLCFHTAGYLSIFCTLNRINEICDFFGLTHFNWNYLAKKITERSVNLSRVNFENLFCRIGLKIIFFRLISIIQFDYFPSWTWQKKAGEKILVMFH